ncbi:MAG: (2Fe-2S)-binding protein, partial [Desulfobacterales bacterium]|nr:(2Fe-2S)-binding protein [Desulfobacterales bacterium]
WIMETSAHLESSCPGIYGAGEVTGVAGVKKSYLEGRRAALALVEKLGKSQDGTQAEMAALDHKLTAQAQYSRFLNRLCRLPRAAWDEIPDQTLICRCEGVTMATLRARVNQGFNTPTALKRASRTGMGRCQGRICGPMIQDILAVLNPDFDLSGARPSLRAPVKNSPIRAYLED